MSIRPLIKISALMLILITGATTTSLSSAEFRSPMTDQQLAAKAKRLQELVETKVLQQHGMVPMFVRASDYQLPTAEDYKGAYRHRHLHGKSEEEVGLPPMHVWRAWENTPTDTAFYLAAMAYQYRVTGDPEALAICRRTLGGLKYIHSLGVSRGERGFLCKPYGGVYSNQASGDQLQSVTWGLAAYRPIAPPEDLAAIDQMMKDFTDYAIRTEYVSPHGYFGRTGAELRSSWEYTWSRAVIFLPTLYLGWEASGDSSVMAEVARWYRTLGEKNEPDVGSDKFLGTGFNQRRNLYLPALLMSMDPEHHEQWRATMLRDFRQGRTGVRPDGTMPFFWRYDGAGGTVTPVGRPDLGFNFVGRSGRSAFFAMGCVSAQRWLPDTDMLSDARRILEGLDEATFRFVMPMDASEPLPPEWRVESEMLDLDCLTAWLCAYWDGRYRGYW